MYIDRQIDRDNLETPIAHIIEKNDVVTYGNVSLQTGGGFCDKNIWQHVEKPANIKKLNIGKHNGYQKIQEHK